MANRRMFSKKILFDDLFATLPAASKTLYIYMNLEADDDGFVGSMRQVLRFAGTNRKSLEMLKERGFVIEFCGGVCVVTHWHLHNCVPKDRYTPTLHIAEKKKVYKNADSIYRLLPIGSTENSLYTK